MIRRPEALACLIAGRNLGDIVIWSGLLRQLIAANYASRYLVWTRAKMACLFEDLPSCEVICSDFPMGTGMRFGFRELVQMLSALARIRARCPSVVLDFVGDFRERTLARLIGGRHLHIGWGRGHRQAHMIRNPLGRGRPLVTVPASVPSIYEGYRLMLEALIGHGDPWPTERAPRPRPIHRIGLHPFASQPSKLWPFDRWRELAQGLHRAGFELWAFSSPEESLALAEIFKDLPVKQLATDIRQYCQDVQQLDLVIGLDSLSMHTAHRFGVPSITLNAGNPPELYAVPTGRTLAASGGCRHYPCFNVAPCRGTSFENACVKAITPAHVLAEVETQVRARAWALSSGRGPASVPMAPPSHEEPESIEQALAHDLLALTQSSDPPGPLAISGGSP